MFCALFFYLIVFIFGLVVGSFLNVVINRLGTKESIWFNRSHCPKCKKTLKWFELVPLLSFIVQKGKCRYCRKKISYQYPLVELATGLLFLIVILEHFADAQHRLCISGAIESRGLIDIVSFYYLIITVFLIIIFAYDLKHYIIPDKVVYPAIVLSLIFNLAKGFYSNNLLSIVYYSLFAILAGGGFFLLIVLISRGKWMGLGDVKLAVFMGLVLGWPNILMALLMSFFFGAVVGLILIAFKKKKFKSEIPFGPFLCLATFITLLYGNQILKWYLNIFYIIPWW